MRIETVFKWIVGIASVINYSNNALYQFFTPVFTEKALDKNIGPTLVGVILAFYSVGMLTQSFTMDWLHGKLASKNTYIVGTTSGAVVSLLAIALNYEP